MATPVLSIGMIFRNDIRCIERCLKALEPLRSALPCELVMADTGSADGSRAVAERYADRIIDFPWTDDFSAARNAVMDQCRGTWYLSVDTDEYLDEDVSELTDFLRGGAKQKLIVATVVVRSYQNWEMTGEYTDFHAVRLLRMSTGMRYEGRIHERWPFPEDQPVSGKPLKRTIFHHDGYVDLFGKAGEAKLERNIALLRKELEEDPDDLRCLMQFLESGRKEPDFQKYLFQAAELVKKEQRGWRDYGPPIFRHAVMEALRGDLPQIEEWISWAEKRFPNSYFFRIDIASCAALFYWKESSKNPEKCIYYGEMYLQGLKDLRSGRGDVSGLLVSSLSYVNARQKLNVLIVLAGAHWAAEHAEQALSCLTEADLAAVDVRQLAEVCNVLYPLHSRTALDTAPVIEALWEGMSAAGAGMKKALLTASGTTLFACAYLEKERWEGVTRRACTVFRPLAGRHALGDAALIMSAEDAAELENSLRSVSDWGSMPPAVLAHTVDRGVRFPLAGRPMPLEEMDALAERLSKDLDALRDIQDKTAEDFAGNWQALAWARALALAGVQACDWTDEARGMELCRTFVKVEREFLPQYYNPELLCAENIHVLPPLHRFGWYCGLAFEALDGGDIAGYVRLLREGLAACEGMKPMVEFLTDHTPQLQTPKPSGELMALAEQVRMLLAQYPADDPAVAALKQSPAYQKVAHLIEGPDLGVLGGLKQ